MSLDLNFHLTQILVGTPHDDIAIALIAQAHYDKCVDLGQHFLVDVLGLLGHDTEPDAKLADFHRALAKDLGA